jgi:hypothetical protein
LIFFYEKNSAFLFHFCENDISCRKTTKNVRACPWNVCMMFVYQWNMNNLTIIMRSLNYYGYITFCMSILHFFRNRFLFPFQKTKRGALKCTIKWRLQKLNRCRYLSNAYHLKQNIFNRHHLILLTTIISFIFYWKKKWVVTAKHHLNIFYII